MPEPVELAIGHWAGAYGHRGLAVFPLHTIEAGHCSCGAARCSSPGKHPIASLVPHGVLDAETHAATIAQWWAVYPDANIGVATGDASGVVVIDVDLRGEDTFDHLTERYGELAPTWMAETGSGGIHLWYQMPAADIRNSASAIGPGIDVRANGGYVVAPPSRHISGGAYCWDELWHPDRIALGVLPDWLLGKVIPGGAHAASPLPRVLTEGMRNTWLASAAGTMRRRGFGEAAITAALRIENRERCKPALDEREIVRIARSIGRYEPWDGARETA
ncbi:MAG TPA: bifunctional DNA primase/polymerase [Tepidisphaeraceae bacterium]|jgi:putative DNA primase/helicase